MQCLYDQESGEPASFMSFDLEGEVIQPIHELSGTVNCEITCVKGTQDGFIILFTEPGLLYNNLMLAYYDFAGNIINTGINNPLTCYSEYAHHEAITAQIYDNNIYFAWQTAVNSFDEHLSLTGGDALLQGWCIPTLTLDSSENEVCLSNKIQIYPNPFNPETRINYYLNTASKIKIEAYNIKGQKLEVILDAERQAGEHSVVWNADGHNSGVYFLRISTGSDYEIVKAILLK